MNTSFARIFLAGLLWVGAMAASGAAHAQAWSEANSPGFVGGYGHFGGYYDTFGPYGGHSTYTGYARTEGGYSRTVTLLTVPLQRRTPGTHRAMKTAHAADDCGWLRRRAHETGKRKWQRRYQACRATA